MRVSSTSKTWTSLNRNYKLQISSGKTTDTLSSESSRLGVEGLDPLNPRLGNLPSTDTSLIKATLRSIELNNDLVRFLVPTFHGRKGKKRSPPEIGNSSFSNVPILTVTSSGPFVRTPHERKGKSVRLQSVWGTSLSEDRTSITTSFVPLFHVPHGCKGRSVQFQGVREKMKDTLYLK